VKSKLTLPRISDRQAQDGLENEALRRRKRGLEEENMAHTKRPVSAE
jgi:hypothetical protein